MAETAEEVAVKQMAADTKTAKKAKEAEMAATQEEKTAADAEEEKVVTLIKADPTDEVMAAGLERVIKRERSCIGMRPLEKQTKNIKICIFSILN